MLKVRDEVTNPVAFLCHTSEDKPTAERLAQDLQANGVDTFFDKWEMRAGDSLRRKIEVGLDRCTHFVALLSPVSLTKPWVNLEMDSALIRKLEGACTFVPLRFGLSVEKLPSLLKGMYSPGIDNYEDDVRQLISDIHGVSRKPPLGQPPAAIAERPSGLGISPAAAVIVRLMIEESEHGAEMDPELEAEFILSETKLPEEDIIDAADELKDAGLAREHASLNSGSIGFDSLIPTTEMFVSMDKHFKPWNPEEDALRVAADLSNSDELSGGIPKLAERYGWEPRRMNPAVNYLVNRGLVQFSNECGTHPWSYLWVGKTAATRRFVKGRSGS